MTDCTIPPDRASDRISRRSLLAGGVMGAAFAPWAMLLAQAGPVAAQEATVAGPPASAPAARAAVAEVKPAILRISREVSENAELSRQEVKSRAIHLRELEAEGFRITSRNTSGYPTAFALKWIMEADGTPGTIRVYGCASGESQGVKVYMVRDGLFDDVDVALAWHPAPVAAPGRSARRPMTASA